MHDYNTNHDSFLRIAINNDKFKPKNPFIIKSLKVLFWLLVVIDLKHGIYVD